MQEIDALGKNRPGLRVFTGELLAEADDAELTAIVEDAAAQLGTPIALVTLVLEHIQLFKAHYGLPPDLEATRATERSVSFCQFVVRDGLPFEVVDAMTDTRIPLALVERYGIRSYLGMPLEVKGVVVGSLCVIDTKARGFSEDEYARLKGLASEVSVRLTWLAERRRRPRASMARRAAVAGLAELRTALAPIRGHAADADIAAATVRSCFRLLQFMRGGGNVPPRAAEGAIDRALRALDDMSDAVTEIEIGMQDAHDCATALESVTQTDTTPYLSDVLAAAQDLARAACRPAGGAPVPDLAVDPMLATPTALAVTVVASMLEAVAQRVEHIGASCGIGIAADTSQFGVLVSVTATALREEDIRELGEQLARGAPQDPTLRLRSGDGSLGVFFATVRAAE
ncbi:MAG: hypothetical protein ACI8PZ_004298 [Myxococcota bacterium]|jgi:hypothetical protein